MNSAWGAVAAGWGQGALIIAALVAVVGALLIHNLGRRGGSGVARAQPGRGTAADTGLIALGERMKDAARRMGIPERVLPRIAVPDAREGDFVFREGSDYVYCGFERGTQMFEHRASESDDLLYRVFCDRAWMHVYFGLKGQDLSPQEQTARLAAGQVELLGKADPRWAERAAQEAAAKASAPGQG
jgi:hypothetical protein